MKEKYFIKNIKFIEPELDYSEFFRHIIHFKKHIPSNIIEPLDNIKYLDQIDNWKLLTKYKYNKSNGLNIKNKINKKWYNIIDFIYNKFINGKYIFLDIDFIINNVRIDYKNIKDDYSFHNFINDKYNYKNNLYFTLSFNWFNKYNKIPIPVLSKINNKYYLSGGNRRLSWLILKEFQIIPFYVVEF